MNGMILHCGAQELTREELATVPTPYPTATHFPVPHHALLGEVSYALVNAGCEIVQEQHGVSADGMRYFGLLRLRGQHGTAGNEYSVIVGVRNSHDMSFSASLAVGASVFVCDNLSFSGDVVLSRKHTRFIGRDLTRLTYAAVDRLNGLRIDQIARFTRYQQTAIADRRDLHDLIMRSVKARALPVSKIPAIVDQWDNPIHDEFSARTVWSLQNAYTEVFKSSRPDTILQRSQSLHGLLDHYCATVRDDDDAIVIDAQPVGPLAIAG